jgi:hypothetical protein
MAIVAPDQPATATCSRHPLCGGDTLVALVAAWIAGIMLRPVDPFSRLTVHAWLLLAGACTIAIVWLFAAVAERESAAALTPSPARWWRILFVSGMPGCWLALGVARATSADPTADVGRHAGLVGRYSQVTPPDPSPSLAARAAGPLAGEAGARSPSPRPRPRLRLRPFVLP